MVCALTPGAGSAGAGGLSLAAAPMGLPGAGHAVAIRMPRGHGRMGEVDHDIVIGLGPMAESY